MVSVAPPSTVSTFRSFVDLGEDEEEEGREEVDGAAIRADGLSYTPLGSIQVWFSASCDMHITLLGHYGIIR